MTRVAYPDRPALRHRPQPAAGALGAVGVAALLLTGCGGGHHASAPTSAAPATASPATTSPAATNPVTTNPATTGTGAPGPAPGAAATSTTAPVASTPSTAPPPLTTPGGGCVTSALHLSLGAGNGAAGSSYTPIVFTNDSGHPCILEGYPGVSFVTGTEGRQVGAPAGRRTGRAAVVTVAPGGTASALLQDADTANFPPQQCRPVPVRGLRVYPPNETAAAFVPFSAPTTACSEIVPVGGSQLSVTPVVPGATGQAAPGAQPNG